MGLVNQTVVIHSPPETVYDLVWRPERATEWIVGMVDTGNVRHGDLETGLGCRFDWTYRMAGFTYRGENRVSEAERPRHLREESSGDLNSTWDWRFERLEGGTRVHLAVTYVPPIGWLGRLLDPIVLKRLNQRALEGTLTNLKQLVENARD
jgi:uncharacterized protein YndB with AHSA1/START domain